MSILQSIIYKMSHTAVVIHKEKITHSTYHIRIKLKTDSFKNYIPGQHLRIIVGLVDNSSLSNMVRTYSVWRYDELRNEADIAICIFSNGQGAKWVQTLEKGDTIYFRGPEGKFTINPDADNHLFYGDISSLAHLYELNRNTGISKKASGIIYSSAKTHYFDDLSSKRNFGFLEAPENPADDIITEISWNGIPKGNTTVYIAGETAFCVALHNYFKKEHGFLPKQIKTKPFWHPNKKGLE
ncbi:FAD-binding oxidoreductase [Flavobacterium sp. DG1-102-2]|uniref:siderophore-interacting protein n=1 Tax=Flavobacterium sp. DG1-102-2 TaxID=3081663 RepID=UPI00294A71E5|nr:FAD-binding oxidoreductase [Flavobacterium sp. DG1-102-2]MDV6168496.1 FAD-binding oxidoreductase [Flavobacterium sp. DG1-102-2]